MNLRAQEYPFFPVWGYTYRQNQKGQQIWIIFFFIINRAPRIKIKFGVTLQRTERKLEKKIIWFLPMPLENSHIWTFLSPRQSHMHETLFWVKRCKMVLCTTISQYVVDFMLISFGWIEFRILILFSSLLTSKILTPKNTKGYLLIQWVSEQHFSLITTVEPRAQSQLRLSFSVIKYTVIFSHSAS